MSIGKAVQSYGHFCVSNMAVSRHLGFYRTANSAIRSADPENPSLEPNMEWIGCTVCEIFAFKLYCDLEIGVRGHSRLPKVAPLDRPTRKTSYWNQTSCRSAKQLRSYPWWPSAAILDFIEPQIAPFDSPTPKNLAYNQTWSGSDYCTVCEIFTFKLYCDLESRVWGQSRSSKKAPFDRALTTLYSSSIVTMPLSITVSEI